MAGDVLSQGDIFVHTPSFIFTRDGTYTVPVANWSWAYSGCYNYCEISDQAFLRALGSIYFSVDKGYCLASTIIAQQKILYGSSSSFERYLSFLVGVSNAEIRDPLLPVLASSHTETRPSSFEVHSRVNYGYGCNDKCGYQRGCSPCSIYHSTIQAGDTIQIQMGDFIISGNLNAFKISIHNQGDTLIRGTAGGRLRPGETGIFDVTDIFRQNARADGFCQLTHGGEIQTEFPLGSPYHHPQMNVIQLESQLSPHPVNPPLDQNCFINPLRQLPSSLFNLWLQKLMGEEMGKVHTTCPIIDNDLQRTFWGNNERCFGEIQKQVLSLEDIKREAKQIMLFEGMKQIAGMLERHTYLAIPPEEYNEEGGVSGNIIEIDSEGDIRVEDGDVIAQENLKMHAGNQLQLVSTVKTYYTDDNGSTTQRVDHPTKVICKNGDAEVTGQQGFLMVGADVSADKGDIIMGSQEGTTDIQDVHMVHTTVHREEKTNWTGTSKTRETTSSTVTSRPSNVYATGKLKVLSGKDKQTTITGSHLKSDELIQFVGGIPDVGTSMGYNTTQTSTESERLFSRSSSTAFQAIPVFFGSSLCSPLIQFLTDGNPIQITGSDIICLMFDAAQAGQVTFDPAIGRMRYFQEARGRSPLSSYNIGCRGYQDVARPSRIQAEKIILNLDPSLKHVMRSVEWHPDAIEILGNYREETVHLDHRHEQWAHFHQKIPAPVVQVLAMAVAYVTGGASLAAGSLVGAAAQAGLQAVVVQFVTSFATHGDPIQAWGDLLQERSLKSIGEAMVKAVVLNQIAPLLSVNMAPGQVGVLPNLYKYALKNAVNASMTMAFHKEKFHGVFAQALRQTALDTGGAVGANLIGLGIQNEFWNVIAHMGLGAGMSPLMGIKPLEGAIAAACSKIMAINFADPEDMEADLKQEGHHPNDKDYAERFMEKRQDRFEKIKLATAFALALCGGVNPQATAYIATNLLENNCGATQCIVNFEKLVKEAEKEKAKRLRKKKEDNSLIYDILTESEEQNRILLFTKENTDELYKTMGLIVASIKEQGYPLLYRTLYLGVNSEVLYAGYLMAKEAAMLHPTTRLGSWFLLAAGSVLTTYDLYEMYHHHFTAGELSCNLMACQVGPRSYSLLLSHFHHLLHKLGVHHFVHKIEGKVSELMVSYLHHYQNGSFSPDVRNVLAQMGRFQHEGFQEIYPCLMREEYRGDENP